jgi:hypothetical protein
MAEIKKQKQSRRAPSTTEEQMLDLHMSPVYGVDLSQDTRLLEMHSRLVELEDRVRFFIEIPLSILRQTSSHIQAAFLEKLPPSLRQKVEEALRGELGRKRRFRRVS